MVSEGYITAEQYEGVATDIADLVDRSLFVRYGDAQAFARNSVSQDRNNRFRPAAENPIADRRAGGGDFGGSRVGCPRYEWESNNENELLNTH